MRNIMNRWTMMFLTVGALATLVLARSVVNEGQQATAALDEVGSRLVTTTLSDVSSAPSTEELSKVESGLAVGSEIRFEKNGRPSNISRATAVAAENAELKKKIAEMSMEDVNEHIRQLDSRIESEQFVERANSGKLTGAEQEELSILLEHRLWLFERKLRLMGV